MFKKITALLTIVFITASCGFTPIYSSKNNYNILIEELSFTGDRKLNNLYEEALEIDSKNKILKYQNEQIAKVVEENIHLLESTGFILES